MEYKKIENTDLSVSSVCLGTWVFGGDMWSGAKEADCIDAVGAAMDCGVNLIDTAPIYGDGVSEEIVGKAIKGKRDKVVIATKCGLIRSGKAIQTNLKPDSIMREIDDSLRRLQTDYVDIYQCHWPDKETPIEKTMETMNKLKESGKVKYVGVSNFGVDLMRESIKLADIITLQTQYSLLERSIESEILPFCRENNIGILTYGSLGGGILSGKYKTAQSFQKGDARSFFYKFYQGKGFDRSCEIIKVLGQTGKPVGQGAINWVRQQEGITSAIIGCRNANQAKENFAATDWALSDEQLAKLSSL